MDAQLKARTFIAPRPFFYLQVNKISYCDITQAGFSVKETKLLLTRGHSELWCDSSQVVLLVKPRWGIS